MKYNNKVNERLRAKGLEVIESWLKILENKKDIESQNLNKIKTSILNNEGRKSSES